jgi:uncharacterized protein YkwD
LLRRNPPRVPTLLLAGAATCLATACPLPLPAPEPVPPAPETVDAEIRDFTRLLNSARRARGCPALTWHARAAAVATEHSRDMAATRRLSHTGSDGRDPFRRLRDAGVTYSGAAENIASGPTTGREVYARWEASPGHRANMMECRYTHHGVGLVDRYWTHVLLRP